MKHLATVLMLLWITITVGAVFIAKIKYQIEVGDYLKRAADANTVERAEKELSTAINYLEANNITSGYTSIIYTTPNEDIGFWYNNLVDSQKELAKVDSTTTQLERSNILIKLRETLLDNDKITNPKGIQRYPHNKFYAIMLTLSAIFSFLIYWKYFIDY